VRFLLASRRLGTRVLRRCIVALGSAWLALSLMLTTMSFPALMQSSSLCDGVDDDPLWEAAILERDEHFIADVRLIGPHSPICNPGSSSDQEVQLSEPLRPRYNPQLGCALRTLRRARTATRIR